MRDQHLLAHVVGGLQIK